MKLIEYCLEESTNYFEVVSLVNRFWYFRSDFVSEYYSA
jgi:hypothetical protein